MVGMRSTLRSARKSSSSDGSSRVWIHLRTATINFRSILHYNMDIISYYISLIVLKMPKSLHSVERRAKLLVSMLRWFGPDMELQQAIRTKDNFWANSNHRVIKFSNDKIKSILVFWRQTKSEKDEYLRLFRGPSRRTGKLWFRWAQAALFPPITLICRIHVLFVLLN